MFKSAAPRFVSKCIGIVISRIIAADNTEGAETGMEKRKAPSMKSIWSATGSELPGERLIRRLIKDSMRSPVKAPKDSMNPRSMLY